MSAGTTPDVAFSRYSNRAPSRSLHNASVFGLIYVWIANSAAYASVTWYLDTVNQGTNSTTATGFPFKGNASNGGGRIVAFDTTTLGDGLHTLQFISDSAQSLTVNFYVFNTVNTTTLAALLNSSANSGTTQTIARGNYDLGSPSNSTYYNAARTNWLRLVANGEVIVSAASNNGFNFRNDAWVSFEGAWHFVGVGVAPARGTRFRIIADGSNHIAEFDLNQIAPNAQGGIANAGITTNGNVSSLATFQDFEGLVGLPLYIHHGNADTLDAYWVSDSTFAHISSDHMKVLMGQAHGDAIQALFACRMTYTDCVFTQQNLLLQNGGYGPQDTVTFTDVVAYSSDRPGWRQETAVGYWATDCTFTRCYSFGHGINDYMEAAPGGSSINATLGLAINVGNSTITLATSNPYAALAVPMHLQVDSEILEVNSWAGLVGTLEVNAVSTHVNGSTVTQPAQPTPYFGSSPPSGLTTGSPPTAWVGTSQPIVVVGPGGAITVAAGVSPLPLTQSGNGNQNGRVMLAVIGGVVGQTISLAGWTQLLTTSGNGSIGDPAIWILYRVKQAGDSAPFNFTITGTSHSVAGRLYNLNGVDTATVVDATAPGSPVSVGAGVNVTAPTVVGTYAGSQRWRVACATVTAANSIGVIAGAGQQVDNSTDPVTVTFNAVPSSWAVGQLIALGMEECQINAINAGANQVTFARALEGTMKTTHNGGDLIFPFWTRPSYLGVASAEESDLGVVTSDGLLLFKCFEPYPLDAPSGDIGSEVISLANAARIVTASFSLKAGVF